MFRLSLPQQWVKSKDALLGFSFWGDDGSDLALKFGADAVLWMCSYLEETATYGEAGGALLSLLTFISLTS